MTYAGIRKRIRFMFGTDNDKKNNVYFWCIYICGFNPIDDERNVKIPCN